MHFDKEQIYHIYNRGNNKQRIFFSNKNYNYFIKKINDHLKNISDILAYCLMPNHFHLLIHTGINCPVEKLNGEIAVILRSYTRAVNIQENRTGSLFQQKTKAKNVSNYGLICINYIHQNPVRSGLTDKIENWEFSSFAEYLNEGQNGLCNVTLSRTILDLPVGDEFYKMSYLAIGSELIDNLF